MTELDDTHCFVVLAYGESPYLENCIKSVLHQSQPGDVVISTSTPNDFIRNLAQKYNLGLKINPEQRGIGSDWNFGLKCSNHNLVTLAHQDDIYFPDYRKSVFEAYNENKPETPLIVFNASKTSNEGNSPRFGYKDFLRWLLVFPFHFKRCISSSFLKTSILAFSNSISCPGVTYVKQNLKEFSFNTNLTYVLDWSAWVEISRKKGAFVYVPKALHSHQEHSGSTTSKTSVNTLQDEEYQLLKNIWESVIIASVLTFILKFTK